MCRHAWPAASHLAEMVKIFQISARPVIKHYFLIGSERLNFLARWDRQCILTISMYSMYQSSTHLLFALHIKPSVNLQLWRTCITPDYLPGIKKKKSQCIPNCKTRVSASTCVTMFAFLPRPISICGCVIDRMPSGLH